MTAKNVDLIQNLAYYVYYLFSCSKKHTCCCMKYFCFLMKFHHLKCATHKYNKLLCV